MMSLERITLDPDLMGGKPCIRGMRVTVGTILGLLAAGHSEKRILRRTRTSNPRTFGRRSLMPCEVKGQRELTAAPISSRFPEAPDGAPLGAA